MSNIDLFRFKYQHTLMYLVLLCLIDILRVFKFRCEKMYICLENNILRGKNYKQLGEVLFQSVVILLR